MFMLSMASVKIWLACISDKESYASCNRVISKLGYKTIISDLFMTQLLSSLEMDTKTQVQILDLAVWKRNVFNYSPSSYE